MFSVVEIHQTHCHLCARRFVHLTRLPTRVETAIRFERNRGADIRLRSCLMCLFVLSHFVACSETLTTEEDVLVASPMATKFQSPDGALDEQRLTVNLVNTGPGYWTFVKSDSRKVMR